MGQGSDSCGGHEVEYDEYEGLLGDGVWSGKDGQTYRITKMENSHLKSCIRVCKNLSRAASFSCDSEKWDDWVRIFEDELERRPSPQHNQTKIGSARVADDPRGKTVERTCRCKSKFMARQADINRGWAKSCSKSCAAKYK